MELELASGSNFALITLLTPQFFNPPPLAGSAPDSLRGGGGIPISSSTKFVASAAVLHHRIVFYS